MLLLLIIFGPGKALSMARDLGRFASEARGHVEEFRGELFLSEEVEEARRPVGESKDGTQRSVEGLKADVAVGEEERELASDITPDKDGARELKSGKELAREKEASPFEEEECAQEELEQRGQGSVEGSGEAKNIRHPKQRI